jgi:predicted kinase
MQKYFIIMQGVSGSGKSFIAETLGKSLLAPVFSTDKLFMVNGKYCFDRGKLGYNHEKTREMVRNAMKDGLPTIILDNTNTTQKEVNPYLEMAKEHGYTVQVVSVQTSVETAKAQNATRPADRLIPESVIDMQAQRIQKLKI